MADIAKQPPKVDLSDPGFANALKAAVPAHCFEKSLPTSLFYMVRDLAIMAALYYFRESLVSNWFNYLLWVNIVGFFGWAMFVVGHDCGHGTFSEYWLVNQICGHIMHTPLLVPFNGWQISHWKHHMFHNNIKKDESWKPMTPSLFAKLTPSGKFVRRSPLILFMFPWYLLSLPDHPLLSGSHFDPWSRLFTPDQRVRAGVSSLSVIAFVVFLLAKFSLKSLFLYFFVPYMIFTAWLSLITLLQHTDPKGTYYDESKWNFAKGAMTTFDRSFGGVINHLHHNIETHLVHHLWFTAIPHYHLVEATAAIKPLLGSSYPYDGTPIPMALWNTVQNCDFIQSEANDGVYEYAREDAQPTQ